MQTKFASQIKHLILSVNLKIFTQLLFRLANWLIKEFFLGIKKVISITVFLTLLIGTYKYVIGSNYSVFTSGQIQSDIQKAIISSNLDYRIFKADFYGFGVESLVVVTFPNPSHVFDLWGKVDSQRILVFDQVQTTALEKQLYDVLYKRQIELSLPDATMNQFRGISTDVVRNNGKDTVFFCISNDTKLCGGIRYQNGFKVIPLIEYSNDELATIYDLPNLKMVTTPSTRGKINLNELDETKIHINQDKKLLFIGAPIGKKAEDIPREMYKYVVCRFHLDPDSGSFILRFDHGAYDCNITEHDYNFLFPGQNALYQGELENFSSGVFEVDDSSL